VRILRIATLAFLVCGSSVLAQTEGIAEFRGTVHTDKGQTIPSQGKVYMSKSAVRVEWETDLREVAKDRKDSGAAGLPQEFRMVMIQKLAEPDRIYIVNDGRKSYAVESTHTERSQTRTARRWKVQKLGRDTVAGFACEKALLTAEDGDQTEVCVTTELAPSNAWLTAWNRREEQASPLKALKDAGLSGFPVRWIFRNRGSKDISSSVELVRFDRKSVSASLFEIPPGYRKVDSMMETMAMTPEQEKALQDARKRMQEALDKMTPEQRKQYEELMRQQGGALAPTPRSR
jgi:Domain of unknown function (DUF4412)